MREPGARRIRQNPVRDCHFTFSRPSCTTREGALCTTGRRCQTASRSNLQQRCRRYSLLLVIVQSAQFVGRDVQVEDIAFPFREELYRHDHPLRRRAIMEGRGCIRCSRSDFTAWILGSARPGRSHTEFRIAKNRQRDTAAVPFACIHSPDIRARRRADQQRIRSDATWDDRGQQAPRYRPRQLQRQLL